MYLSIYIHIHYIYLMWLATSNTRIDILLRLVFLNSCPPHSGYHRVDNSLCSVRDIWGH